MGSDDFLVPGNVDLFTNCDIDQAVLHKGTVLRLFACLSIASYSYLFWMYFVVKTPVLRRHPTSLAIYGCIIEMAYFQQYLWLPTIGKDYLYSDDAMTAPFYCNSSLAASRWAFITQFSMVGVQLCFLVISMDLRLAYTNPFSSYKNNKLYYAAIVVLGALFTALCLLAMGPRVYGYDEHGVVWIQDSRANLAMNWPKFMLYYLVVTCIYCYSLWANFQFYRSNEKGLSVTISNRLSIMNRSKRFVLGHICVDAFILSLEFLSFVFGSNQQVLLAIPSYLQALRGVLGMCVILYSNGQDISWESMNPFYFPSSAKDKNMVEKVALEGLLQQPHLNTALRAEILYFSTQGIMFAARSFEQNAGADRQDERVQAEREKAFMEQVEYLGLARGSVSFREADGRHNSTSSLNSPYTFTLGRVPHVPTLVASNTAQNAMRASLHPVYVDTRNPMSSTMGGAKARNSEVELRASTISRLDSVESAGTASSVSTVKWRDTMDVEFSMGRVENGNKLASDAWYRVPSVPKKKAEEERNSTAQQSEQSDSSGGTTVNRVKRTLQNALSNAQSMFNPAFKEFRFKDFSPGYFAKVRAMCSITADEYGRSFEATCKETFLEGRSGAFMFFSSDQKCIAKSTSKSELLSLQRLMPFYVEYLTANPNTLFTRFLGAHCITMYGVELYFIVMLNCFPSTRLSERYDLKGSWVNRHAFTKTDFGAAGRAKEAVKSPMLYLDNDLQHKLSLQPGVASQISEQIFKDVEFLTVHKKMDYSLLIGVKKERFEVLSSPTADSGEDSRESTVTISTRNGRLTDHMLGRSMSAFQSPGLMYQASPSATSPVGKAPTTALRALRRAEDDDPEYEEEDGGLHTRFVEGPAKYYIGIIDMLQEWTLQKQLERAIKVYLYQYDAHGISAMNPADYSRRFLRRCVLDTFEGLEERAGSYATTRTGDESARGHSAAASHGSMTGAY